MVIEQADTTNNPTALVVKNSGTGVGIDMSAAGVTGKALKATIGAAASGSITGSIAILSEGDAVRCEHLTMYEVVNGFTDKDAALEIRTEESAAIRRWAICARDHAIGTRHVWTFHSWTYRKATTRVGVVEKHLAGILDDQVRVTCNVVKRQVDVPKPIWIVVAEPVSPVVPVQTELGLVGQGLHLARDLEAKVAAIDVHDFARGGALDHSSTVAICGVNPIVQAKDEAVHAMLLIAFAKTGEEDTAYIGTTVAR